MSSLSANEFPQKLSRYFKFDNKTYPRGGVLKYGKKVMLLGATATHAIALRQSYSGLMITELPSLNSIPEPPNAHLQTVDELLLYAYKVLFTPYFAEVVKGNKVIMVGVIFSSNITKNRQVYWVYDPETDTRNKFEIIKGEDIFIRYSEISPNDLDGIITKMFNPNGIKEMLRQYLERGLFTLDSYGE